MLRTSCAGRSPKPSHVRGGTGATCHGDVADKECTCLASSVMRERYPPSPPFCRELIRLADCKSAVTKRAGSRRVEHYHQLPPFAAPGFRSRSSRGARLSTVSLAGASPAGIGAAHGSFFNRVRGRHQSARLGSERHPGKHRGARPFFLLIAQQIRAGVF